MANKTEEIIELTEVIEEEPLPTEKEGRSSPFLSIPASPLKDPRGQGIHPTGKEDLVLKKPLDDSPSVPSSGYEAEIKTLQERWNARMEAWLAKEGNAILERIAREQFPKIAEKILRSEIEKIKIEIEEQE